jgi:4-amino-4-deoxy-L-arabinose transferase-like glycosyltransferase
MFVSLRRLSPVQIVALLLVIVTGFRLWYSTQIGLVADEAYYWLWAQHPALSYRDKGPMVAWLIWAGTKMFGNTVFGIRFFGVLLSSAAGLVIFKLAKQLYDERTALWCLLMALLVPELAVGSLLMTIDTPSVFCWALAALLFWNALHNDKMSTWFWLGLAVGAGFLAKFTNGVQLICIGLFLLWSKEYRRLLFSPQVLIMGAGFLLASLPIFIWNMQTGWVHLMALHSRSGVTNTFHIRPDQFFRFMGEQFGVVSPFFMGGIIVAAIALLLHRREDERVRYLLSQCLPLYALFGFFALNNAGQPNWTVPALVTAIIFTVVFWRDLVQRNEVWRWSVRVAFAITAICVVFIHCMAWFPVPRKINLMSRTEGWPSFAEQVQRIRLENQANLLLGADYQSASLMAFYLPDQPTVYLPPEPYGRTQFTLWPQYTVTPVTHALYVTWGPRDPPPALAKQFTHFKLLENFMTQEHGQSLRQVCVYLCTP